MISFSPELFSIENLHRAYLKCRKGKRGAIHTRGFEINLYNELQNLSKALLNGSYKPSRSVCFYVTKPKLREIFAAHFRDRVVHRLLVDILEPVYERKFIADSYACRRGKGTHRGVERVKEFISRGTKKAKSHFYYLQLDIKGFFMEIHKSTLLKILSKTITDVTLFSLCKVIVNHNPAEHFVYKGLIPKKGILPPHKTLFHEDKERGIPIGNLTSQFFANVYLNELDQYCKRGLGIKYYIRYVDDFLLLHDDPEQLLEWKEKIIQYLKQKLKLTLKDGYIRIPRILSRFSSFRNQIWYFLKHYPKHLLIVPVGRLYEFYGEHSEEIRTHFQLKQRYRSNLVSCGIKIKKGKYTKDRLKEVIHYCYHRCISYVLFKESQELVGKIKIRIPIYRQTQIHPIQLELFYNSEIYKTKRRK